MLLEEFCEDDKFFLYFVLNLILLNQPTINTSLSRCTVLWLEYKTCEKCYRQLPRLGDVFSVLYFVQIFTYCDKMCFKLFTDCINKSYRTPEATVEDVSQRVRRVYKSLILAKTLRMRSSMRCLGGLVILVLGVVHILRNHFWGFWETPPPL